METIMQVFTDMLGLFSLPIDVAGIGEVDILTIVLFGAFCSLIVSIGRTALR
jgi:hypothetical protein